MILSIDTVVIIRFMGSNENVTFLLLTVICPAIPIVLVIKEEFAKAVMVTDLLALSFIIDVWQVVNHVAKQHAVTIFEQL